jgi:phage tail protein X
MQNRIVKPALAAIVMACAALAAYWYWSPYLALRAMQSAAIARDADAFNAHVDYPQVRASLKAQLSTRMAAQIGATADANNPLAALGAMLGRTMSDKLVDAMVRPETIMQVMQHGQFGPAAPDAGTTTDAAPAEAPQSANSPSNKQKWIILREGADRMVAMPEDSAGAPEKQVNIVFERSGFAQWKLTGVRMPAH